MTQRPPSSRPNLMRDESGAALVEFVFVLPMMILVFVVIVEAARIMFAYQSAIASVRDATRYLARVVPSSICATGGSLSGYDARVRQIAGQDLGGAALPGGVTVGSVSASLACVTGGGYRINPMPVATVTAIVTIDLPFLRNVPGAATRSSITTTVQDQARVFGS